MTTILSGDEARCTNTPARAGLDELREQVTHALLDAGYQWHDRRQTEIRMRCLDPAHPDTNPSADWNAVKGTWVCRSCGKGGGTVDVARTLGINGGAKPKARTKTRVRPVREVAAFDYTDEDGARLFQVVRYEPKDFRQRRDDPVNPDGWLYSLDGVRRVLYHLPELVAAQREGGGVVIVEGEADADRLRALGFIATCNPGGAGKWREEYRDVLRGLPVTVCADNDLPGHRHAEQVAQSVAAVARSVTVWTPDGVPPKGDVSDWLDAHDNNGDALRAALNADPRQSTRGTAEPVRTLDHVTEEPIQWLARPYIAAHRVTLIGGDPGAGKSQAVLSMVARYTNGAALLPGCAPPIDPRNVLLLDGENDIASVVKPRFRVAGGKANRVRFWDTSRAPLPTISDKLSTIERAVEDHNVGLLIIDPLQALLGAKVDTHRASQVRPLLTGLMTLGSTHACTVVVVVHLNKGEGTRALYRLLDSIDFAAAARSVLLIGRDQDQPGYRVLAHAKSSLAPEGPSLSFDIAAGNTRDEPPLIRWHGTVDTSADDLVAPEQIHRRRRVDDAAEWLRDALAGGEQPRDDVFTAAEGIGFGDTIVKRAAQTLRVQSRSTGEYPNRVMWSLPPSEAL